MAAAAAGDGAPSLPGLGEQLPYCEQSGCTYLDYNATSPIFPEVGTACAMCQCCV